jgi:hypothetical protein
MINEEIIKIFSEKITGYKLNVFVATDDDALKFSFNKSFERNDITYVTGEKTLDFECFIKENFTANVTNFEQRIKIFKNKSFETLKIQIESHTIFILPEEEIALKKALEFVVYRSIIRDYTILRRVPLRKPLKLSAISNVY